MESIEAQTIVSWANSLVNFLEVQGHSKGMVFASIGVDLDMLNKDQMRCSLSTLSKLWHYAYSQYGTGVGLQVALYSRPNHWSIVGLALQSCKHLDDFIIRICEYIPLISNAIELRYEPSVVAAKKLTTRFVQPVELVNERIESYIASALELVKLIYGYLPEIQRVDLPRTQPANPSPWYGTFGPHILWNAEEFSLHFSQEVLETKAPHVDYRLSKIHETELAERLQQLSTQSLSQQIREQILLMLPDGEPSMKDMAKVLHTSTRSLQRHLEEEGLGFRKLIDSVRLKLAQHYLALTAYSLYEIALRTGFSNQSNFSNAFKRWTGITPAQYREQQQETDEHQCF